MNKSEWLNHPNPHIQKQIAKAMSQPTKQSQNGLEGIAKQNILNWQQGQLKKDFVFDVEPVSKPRMTQRDGT